MRYNRLSILCGSVIHSLARSAALMALLVSVLLSVDILTATSALAWAPILLLLKK